MRPPWEVLGVSRGASQEEIKAQWRLLCKQHHPDLQPAHLRGTAERSFKEISSAYRALSARSSNLAGFADFTAASAAAQQGSPYSAGFRTAWAAGGSQPKFSNGVVASLLFIPLALTGLWLAFRFDEEELDQWRPHGLLGPPDNPFLKDDMRPKVHSHLRAYMQRRQLAEEQAAAGGSAAAAAAAAASAAAGSQSAGRIEPDRGRQNAEPTAAT